MITIRQEVLRNITINLEKLYEKANMMLQELINLDKCYVINKFFSEDPLDFTIIFSTKRLIAHSVTVKHFAIDATYKLNWNHYPAIILTTTDGNSQFHPILFEITCSENTKKLQLIPQMCQESQI